MTGFDIAFWVLVGLDLVFIGVLTYFGLRMLEAMKRGRRRAAPALREAMALADRGKALAVRAATDGEAAVSRVKAVAGRVKHRVETTRRIAREVRPGAQAVTSARQTVAKGARVSPEPREGSARTLGDIGRRLARVKSAAEAAAGATRES